MNNNALPTAKQHHYYPCIVVYTLLHTRMNQKVSGQAKSMDLPGVLFELIQPSRENRKKNILGKRKNWQFYMSNIS